MSRASVASATYSAFISYSHRDRAFAERLQRSIEHYRLPRHIARAAGAAKLKPVFRDRDDLSAAPDLTAAVREGLRRSAHLIVVCTPNSATSEWVGREIDSFRSLHGDARILPALFDGTTANALHPALLKTRRGARTQPLAADFRRGGDGRLALLKLVAVLAGVRLDELVQRDAQRRLRHILLIATGAVMAVVGAAALMLMAMQARADAERERERGADAAKYQVTELRDRLLAVGSIKALNAASEGAKRFFKGRDLATISPAEAIIEATRLQGDAETKEAEGKPAEARVAALAARRLTSALLAANPDNTDVIMAHAQSEYWLGFTDWRRGDAAAARRGFERYAARAEQLVARNPASLDWRMERGYAQSNLGMLAMREAIDMADARRFFEAAQKNFLAVATARPYDADLQLEIADGEAWLADVERIGGKYDAALRHRLEQRRILENLLTASPRNARYRVGLIATRLGIARIAAARGDFRTALTGLDAAHAVAAELTDADTDNASVARQKRAIEVFKVQTWLAMPARQRPDAAVISKTLGNCELEWTKADNRELAALCKIQLAALQALQGDRPRALTTLNGVNRHFGRVTGLTERWRVNLGSEIQRVQSSFW